MLKAEKEEDCSLVEGPKAKNSTRAKSGELLVPGKAESISALLCTSVGEGL